MKKLRFAVIGCGGIGKVHVWALAGIRNIEMVAVADSLEDRARKLALEYNLDWYTDYHQLLSRHDIDVVTIATPSGLHAEMAMAAAKSGKHIIVEKSMAINLEDADRMIEVCQKMGVKLSVISQLRFDKSTFKVKKAIETGEIGKLVSGSVDVNYYRTQEYYNNSGWKGTRKMDGGGVLINQGIHFIDLLQWIVGPVESIYAHTATRVHKLDVEDVGVSVLRFKSGALGVIEATTAAYGSLPNSLEIHGEKGTYLLEEHGEKMSLRRFHREESREVEKTFAREKDDSEDIFGSAHRDQFQDVVNAINENRRPLIDGLEGRKPLEIIMGIYQSARTGKVVKLPLPGTKNKRSLREEQK